MRKLTFREKVLLLILAFLILNVVGISYLVLPGYNQAKKAYQNYNDTQTEYQSRKQMIALTANYQSQLEAVKKQYEEEKPNFLKVASVEELDAYLHSLIDDLSTSYSATFTITDNTCNIELAGSGSADTLKAIVDRIQNSTDAIYVVDYEINGSGINSSLMATVIGYKE